jgi:hypothetical protein
MAQTICVGTVPGPSVCGPTHALALLPGKPLSEVGSGRSALCGRRPRFGLQNLAHNIRRLVGLERLAAAWAPEGAPRGMNRRANTSNLQTKMTVPMREQEIRRKITIVRGPFSDYSQVIGGVA